MAAFEEPEEGKPLPKGFTKAEGFLMLGAELGLCRKARWVKLGNRASGTRAPSYAGAAACGSARAALTCAALCWA